MMRSITAAKTGRRKIRLWAVLFWLLVWQAAALWIGEEILLVSPLAVLVRLSEQALNPVFWRTVLFSFTRIVSGFFLAMAGGTVLAVLATRFSWVRELLAPVISMAKATPLASFVILALIWIPSRNLSVFISFLMVLPILYTNVLEGITCTDKKLLEMADLFGVGVGRRIRYIYLSQVLPFFRSACSVSLGLCWKSGISAEIIGIPKGSIGESLYESKLYLDTPDLFAWTVVIILISLLFEKLFLRLVDAVVAHLERS